MKVVIAGGTGFLGNPLAWAWAEEGHDVRVLTRSLPPGQAQHESGTGKPGITRVGWAPDGHAGMLAREFEGASVLVNLAGESIAGGRWTTARKQALHDSRILATRSLVAALAMLKDDGPATVISGSGVGYYGDRGREPLTEDSTAGSDFLARLCVDWEAEARKVEDTRRLVLLRSGVALERSGGALARMLRPFKMGVGGPLGSGKQYMAWIHRHDWVEMVRWIADTPSVCGPVNASAPHPVSNREFSRALGRALRRPALLRAPRVALRVALGEIADALLTSQRAHPTRANAAGYHFRYPEIDIAFRGIFGD